MSSLSCLPCSEHGGNAGMKSLGTHSSSYAVWPYPGVRFPKPVQVSGNLLLLRGPDFPLLPVETTLEGRPERQEPVDKILKLMFR